MLDDAYHFLGSRGLTANHCTIEKPYIVTNGEMPLKEKTQKGLSPSEPATDEPCERFVKTNGIPNGVFYGNRFDTTDCDIYPRLLVWSAAEETGIHRLMSVWQEYFKNFDSGNLAEGISYMDKLAYTLDHCRSSLPWKSFALVDSASKMNRIKDLISRPIRSGEGPSVGFVFTGQGAAYNKMGAALLAYPVFRDTLESFDKELMRLGCEWSVLGKALT